MANNFAPEPLAMPVLAPLKNSYDIDLVRSQR
jgi:hypothetical protein